MKYQLCFGTSMVLNVASIIEHDFTLWCAATAFIVLGFYFFKRKALEDK